MPAATHTCEFEGCGWKLETDNLEHYISLLKIHVDARHKQQTVSAKAEKAKRPDLLRVPLEALQEGLRSYRRGHSDPAVGVLQRGPEA